MKINTFKRLTCAIALSFFSTAAFSQDMDLDDFLQDQEYLGDSEKIIGAYISPLMKSISAGLNQGWYNTAKPHKLIGIDITVTVNAMSIPNNQTSFNVEKLGLKNIALDPASEGYPKAPTVFGSDRTPEFIIRDNNGNAIPDSEFDGAPGIGLKEEIGKNIVPVPMAQIGIGLPKGTDLKFRYVPTLDFEDGDFKFNLFGIGVMHDVKQWIPGIKLLPFDLSAFVGYTRMSMEMKHEQEGFEEGNQRSELEMNATTIQGVISKKISVLTLYGGLGYNIAKSSIAVKGEYDVDEDGVGDITNPVSLDFAASGPRVTAGFRLKLAILTLHADYTLQKYSALTAGVGLSIR